MGLVRNSARALWIVILLSVLLCTRLPAPCNSLRETESFTAWTLHLVIRSLPSTEGPVGVVFSLFLWSPLPLTCSYEHTHSVPFFLNTFLMTRFPYTHYCISWFFFFFYFIGLKFLSFWYQEWNSGPVRARQALVLPGCARRPSWFVFAVTDSPVCPVSSSVPSFHPSWIKCRDAHRVTSSLDSRLPGNCFRSKCVGDAVISFEALPVLSDTYSSPLFNPAASLAHSRHFPSPQSTPALYEFHSTYWFCAYYIYIKCVVSLLCPHQNIILEHVFWGQRLCCVW